jgi:hypothetical protein
MSVVVASTGWDVVRAETELEHTALAAELLARAIDDAVRTRGRACVALSGGTTPGPAYRKLTEYDLPLDRIDWFWVDERRLRLIICAPTIERSSKICSWGASTLRVFIAWRLMFPI